MCALSFLTAAYGCLVDLTVNSTSPVPLHLLMRVRVWLAESSSSARRGQNSLGRVEKNNQWFFIWNNPWMPVSVFSFTNPSIWCYFVHTLLSCHACTSVLYPITSGAYDLLDITLLWHYFLFLPFFNPSFLLCLFHFCAHAFMLPVFLINVCYIFLFSIFVWNFNGCVAWG